MPRYKFSPDMKYGPYTTNMEVYDSETGKEEFRKIIFNEEFDTKHYLSNSFMESEHLEFISDEPFVSPVLCSICGTGILQLTVPDCSAPFDILVFNGDSKSEVWFNNHISSRFTIMPGFSGVIMHAAMSGDIRTVNLNSVDEISAALIKNGSGQKI